MSTGRSRFFLHTMGRGMEAPNRATPGSSTLGSDACCEAPPSSSKQYRSHRHPWLTTHNAMPYQFKREPLMPEEANRLASACQTAREKLLVWTLLDTGLRVAEL